MKVTLDKDYKNWMTVSELERAKQMITEFKTDFDLTPAYYAEQAAREILAAYKADGITDWVDAVLTASAEISGNGRLYDYWGDGTGKLDVWITAKVTTSWGYLELARGGHRGNDESRIGRAHSSGWDASLADRGHATYLHR